MLFAVFQQIHALRAGHGGDGLGLAGHAGHIIQQVILLLGGKGLPVRLLDEVKGDGADLLQVFGLLFQIHVVPGAEELGVRELFLLSHQWAPPFLWSFLISSDSTKACTRVRSWPELPLLYRRSILSTGQSYSSCMMWLTSARSKPQ